MVPIVAHFCFTSPYQQQPPIATRHPSMLGAVTGFLKMMMLEKMTKTVFTLPATVTVTEDVALRTTKRVMFKTKEISPLNNKMRKCPFVRNGLCIQAKTSADSK